MKVFNRALDHRRRPRPQGVQGHTSGRPCHLPLREGPKPQAIGPSDGDWGVGDLAKADHVGRHNWQARCQRLDHDLRDAFCLSRVDEDVRSAH
jgi:hypothetical protein